MSPQEICGGAQDICALFPLYIYNSLILKKATKFTYAQQILYF